MSLPNLPRCRNLAIGCLILAMLALAIATGFRERARLGRDFLPGYQAGRLLNLDQADRLYDSASGFWGPPVYTGLFAAIAHLPFNLALDLWWTASLLALAISCLLLVRMLPATATRNTRLALVCLLACSPPCVSALLHGQSTLFELLIACLVTRLWWMARQDDSPASTAFLAGAAAGLLLFRPVMAALLGCMLILALGRRALAGFCLALCGFVLLCVTATPQLVEAYLFRLPAQIGRMQEGLGLAWDQQVTLKALWRVTVQGHVIGRMRHLTAVLWALSVLAMASYLLSATARHLRRVRSRFDTSSPTALIAATLTALPLLLPFASQDTLVLLSIPATLLAGQWLERTTKPTLADAALVGLWGGLYGALALGTIMPIGVQVVAVLLAGLAILHTGCVFRQETIPLRLLEIEGEAGPRSLAA